MYKLFFTLLLACFSLSALAGGSLRFATTDANPPFAFMNKDNQLVGFDIDVAKAICKRMQSECVFINNDFALLLSSLRFQRYDAVISGVDITYQRLEQVDFTQPYLLNAGVIIARKNRYHSLIDLKGKRVAVGGGTTQQAYLQSEWPDIIPVIYDNYENALLDMHNSRLDGIFGDEPSVRQLLKTNPQLGIVGEPITDNRYFGRGIGIAVRKNNVQLLKQLNDALNVLKEDGTLHQLTLRWLGPGR